jgi:hypothetical protein
LRRQIKADLAVIDKSNPEQLRLSFAELTDDPKRSSWTLPCVR